MVINTRIADCKYNRLLTIFFMARFLATPKITLNRWHPEQ